MKPYIFKSRSISSISFELIITLVSTNVMTKTSRVKYELFVIVSGSPNFKISPIGESAKIQLHHRNSTDTAWVKPTVWTQGVGAMRVLPNNKKTRLAFGERDIIHDTYGLGLMYLALTLKYRIHTGTPNRPYIDFSDVGTKGMIILPPIGRGPILRVDSRNPKWRATESYVKIGGVWRKAIPYRKVGDDWEIITGGGFNPNEKINRNYKG